MNIDALLQLLGRLHPLVLHIPIGALVVLVGVECFARLRREQLPQPLRIVMLLMTITAAAAAIASGLLMSQEGGYPSDQVDLHKWLGIAFGIVLLATLVAAIAREQRAYAGLLIAACLVMTPAGHFGASLTHGPRFLLEPFDEPVPVAVRSLSDRPDHLTEYAFVIEPILIARCAGCHGADRTKGGLAVHTPDALMRGGDSGAAVIPFSPESSLLLQRMLLPIDHDEHMPPSNKPQPAPEEIEAIRNWIQSGASFTEAATAASSPSTPAQGNEPPPALPEAALIEALRARLIHVEPLEQASHLLVVDASTAMPPVGDNDVEQFLAPLAPHIAHLSLARSAITDSSMPAIASMTNLQQLNLARTSISDHGLRSLRGHESLAVLNITECRALSQDSLETLASLASAKSIFAWGTGLTREIVNASWPTGASPVVDLGDVPPSAPLADVQTPSSTPADLDAARRQALAPVNTVCPVAGSPIDPRFALVHDNRVVAFCCAKCLATFLADPQRYPVAP